MYILDTDHLSLIQRKGIAGQNILQRILESPENAFSVTVITYEEQLRGRLSFLSRAKTVDEQVSAYQWLQQLKADYTSISMVAFSRVAIVEYQRLRKAYPRLGSMDLRIAAIALVNQSTLLTKNTSDFGQILELRIDDWSAN